MARWNVGLKTYSDVYAYVEVEAETAREAETKALKAKDKWRWQWSGWGDPEKVIVEEVDFLEED